MAKSATARCAPGRFRGAAEISRLKMTAISRNRCATSGRVAPRAAALLRYVLHRCHTALVIPRWVQPAPIVVSSVAMSRVIQIRDVPDEVHDALTGAAEARGLSLTKFMLRELEHLAERGQVVHDNAVVARETRSKVRGRVDRDTILAALHEGRGD